MPVKEILLLGNPKLYEVCEGDKREELATLSPIGQDLHDTLIDFKKRYGAGRAIAAPQIGVMKRLIYMYIDEPKVFVNPVLNRKSKEMMTVWDDCMCFPDLSVKVERHRRCRITYKDVEWKEQAMMLEGDLSELLQHECEIASSFHSLQGRFTQGVCINFDERMRCRADEYQNSFSSAQR